MQGANNFSDGSYLAYLKMKVWVNFLSFRSWKIKGFFPKTKMRGLEALLLCLISLVDRIDLKKQNKKHQKNPNKTKQKPKGPQTHSFHEVLMAVVGNSAGNCRGRIGFHHSGISFTAYSSLNSEICRMHSSANFKLLV